MFSACISKRGNPNIWKCCKKRESLLDSLNNLLKECSSNQGFILGGDFNTEIMPMASFIGNAVANHQTSLTLRQSAWKDLQEVISNHRLCVLNTFQKWQPTYSGKGPGGEQVQTRIDYVMTWAKQADASSKTCQYVRDCELVAHRSTAQHIPILCNIRKAWRPGPAHQRLSAAHAQPVQCTPHLSLYKDRHWQRGISHMWGAYREYKQHARVNLCTVWRVWRGFAAFTRPSRTFRREAHAGKKQLVTDFLAQTGQCQLGKDSAR